MVTSSITSSSSLCRIATPPSRCTRRTPYLLRTTLQRVQAESLLPGVPRRALQVAQSLESEALFQLGALNTTAATPAASKAAARTRSHRRDLRTPYLTKHQPKSRMRENRTSGFVPRLVIPVNPRPIFHTAFELGFGHHKANSRWESGSDSIISVLPVIRPEFHTAGILRCTGWIVR